MHEPSTRSGIRREDAYICDCASTRSQNACVPGTSGSSGRRVWEFRTSARRIPRYHNAYFAEAYCPSHKGNEYVKLFFSGRGIQTLTLLDLVYVDLLYLHRSFFARAISDHPKDPLGSPYGTSVIAAYRSAGSLVALMRNLHTQLKEPSERMWFLWTHMFSCAVSGFVMWI
jgi:hypothetical protein